MGVGSNSFDYARRGATARILLGTGRPGNALDARALVELRHCLLAARDDAGGRVVVLEASGTDFCAGLDLEFAAAADPAEASEFCRGFWDCLELIVHSKKPVIAAVRGRVRGGGLGVVAACDWVIARSCATFQLPEVLLGMVPALVTPFLLRRVAPARLAGLALTTKTLSAAEACQWGLADALSGDDLEAEVARQVRRLLCASPAAVAAFKTYLLASTADDFERRKCLALGEAERWLSTPHVVQSLREFSEGLTPSWFVNRAEASEVEA